MRASKKQIKNAVARLYDIQTKRINTLVRCCFASDLCSGHCSSTLLCKQNCDFAYADHCSLTLAKDVQ